jgi:hypothetical protein
MGTMGLLSPISTGIYDYLQLENTNYQTPGKHNGIILLRWQMDAILSDKRKQSSVVVSESCISCCLGKML